MRIVLLAKAVPVVGDERLGDDLRTVREKLEPNGADEYGAEAALRLVDAGQAEVAVLAMGPAPSVEAIRKLLAMGAGSATLVSDPALAGACTLVTGRVLAAALRRLEFDLVIAGAASSDGGAGVVPAAVAARLGLPFVSNVTAVGERTGTTIRLERLGAAGPETVEVPLPAVITGSQLLGEPRYPSFKGILAARSKPLATWTLADLGLDPQGADVTATVTTAAAEVAETGRAGERVTGSADEAVQRILDLLASKGVAA